MPYYSFKNDYSEGCHPRILEALSETNLSQQKGYGDDQYSQEARELIRQQLNDDTADVHFVSGGTQANLIVIAAILHNTESVIAADSGHIYLHEAGAIEATGHRIETVHSADGKLTIEGIASILVNRGDINKPQPRLVYISNATEAGSIYTKSELTALSEYCKSNDLYLFVDGARLASALTASANDLTLAELSDLVDVFYIGGTKTGALFGEAIVVHHPGLKTRIKHTIKQRGGLLAKGRILGIQFRALFHEGLIFELAKRANTLASALANQIRELGYEFQTPPASNQLFVILPDTIIPQLQEKYGFYVWEKWDDSHSVIRLVTSWATDELACDLFIEDLKALRKGEVVKL